MPHEDPTRIEATESTLEEERSRLENNLTDLGNNLNELESSSPSRMAQIEAFLDKTQALMIGGIIGMGGYYGLQEATSSGDWEKFALNLGIGVAGGKVFQMLSQHYSRKNKK